MHWFDIGCTVAAILSTVWGFCRGLVRALCALVGLVLALVLASGAYPAVVPFLDPPIPAPWARQAVAFCLIFLAVMAVVLVCGRLLHLALRAAGLSLADRLLGGLFGLATVVLITSGLLLITSKVFPSARAHLEAESVLAPLLWQSAAYLEAFLTQHDDALQRLYQQLHR